MRRREFLGVFGGAAAWPAVARGQQSTMAVSEFSGVRRLRAMHPDWRPFKQGLNEDGFVEGRNLAMEFRWANDQLDRLPDMAADLVRGRVDVDRGNRQQSAGSCCQGSNHEYSNRVFDGCRPRTTWYCRQPRKTGR